MVVKQMMWIYGIDNVRGGSYSETDPFTPEQRQFLVRELRGAADVCFKCGEASHWVKKCKKEDNLRTTPSYQRPSIA